ncbi:MAG: hypothetical protein Q9174_000609 [Haloplaca sp. 1 TL-2023]
MDSGAGGTRGGEDVDPDPELRRQRSSGSVKRARQRAAAGLPAEGRDPLEPAPLRITPNRTPPRAATPNEERAHSLPQQHDNHVPVPPIVPPQQTPSPSSTASITPTTPQLPSTSTSIATRLRPSNSNKDDHVARAPPPKRPPRPENVPPLNPDTLNQQSPNYWENNFIPPPTTYSKTLGNVGRRSSGPSPADVPEFPMALNPPATHQPRRNLGPPPSARKGGANFYPQNTFVAPIPEEQPESRSSLASSHAMPNSWGDGPAHQYMGSGISEEDEDDLQSPTSTIDGRDSRAGDHDESTNLVRKVSIGKPGKPALKSLKDPDGGLDETSKAGQGVQFGPGAGLPTFLAPSSNNTSPAATLGDKEIELGYSLSGTASPTSPVDPRVAKILGGLEKGGALSTAGTTPRASTAGSMSDKGGKRPPRLKLDAVKESEPRGSATSLPELIRRATRLASNLDRGKTASRIGMLEMLEKEKEKSRQPSRSGSISDMLAAFPSPSLATPTLGRGSPRFPHSPRSRSHLNRDFTVTPDQSEYSRQKGRRCCGLPIWAFILLCIILLLLIAAAIIIPITLIVLPRQNSSSSSDGVAGCRDSFPCANRGTSVLEAGSCRCICMNGFTGSACGTPADSGCTVRTIETGNESSTVYENATVGTSIGRLLAAGDLNYSIPLDPSIVLSRFSAQNLTCTSENALVTFNGKPQRRKRDGTLEGRQLKLEELLYRRNPTPVAAQLANRASPEQAAVTSNGLVYAAPSNDASSSEDVSPASPSPSSSSRPSPSPKTPSSPPSSTSDSTNSSSSTTRPLTSNILDFARTAVLFILQERDLPTAVSAQQHMQMIFTPAISGNEADDDTFNASTVSVAGGIKIDWETMSVDLGNGTEFGGRGEG